MGKFINSDKKITIDSLVVGFKDRMNNPYYNMSDKKPSIVTYYTHNFEHSTLDEATKLEYSALGDQSPTKYNKILDFFLYGVERITVDLENGEYGLESNAIEGEAIVLPNTIIPIPGDYFSIDYLEKKILFRINNVSKDTLESGANFYKIAYKLDQLTDEVINEQIISNYNLVINNVGTRLNAVIKSEDYDFILILEEILIRLKKYYKNLFYNQRVQTFTFTMDSFPFYDMYLIEFLIRNRLLDGDGEYIHIAHQTVTPATFDIDYDKTFFRNVENRSIINIADRIKSTAKVITDPISIFSSRKENYYSIQYGKGFNGMEYITNIDPYLIEAITENKMTTENNIYYNIIVKYFNNDKLNSSDIEALENIDYESNIALFYCIPIIIYAIEDCIKNIL